MPAWVPRMAQLPSYLNQPWPITRQRDRRALIAPLVLSAGDKVTYRGWCNNIHEGGLGATIAVPLKKNNEVTLQFDIPGSSEAIVVRGVVRHKNGFRYGFEFLNLSPAQHSQIIAFLSPKNRKRRNTLRSRHGQNSRPVAGDKDMRLVLDLPVLA